MIDLTEDNDPMLFCVQIPSGKLIVQYMETLATLQDAAGLQEQPSVPQIAKAIRDSARTKEVAAEASDAVLIAAWHRMTARVQAAGNG
jgi:hypothetical protein